MSGDGKQQQTATQSTTPFPAAIPGLTAGMTKATQLASGNNLVKPLTMSTVVPYADQTMAGMKDIQSTAQAGMAPGGYKDQWSSILSGGGYNADQTAARDGIMSTATGAFDINANPAYSQVRQRAIDEALNGAGSVASGMGRYGSGTHQGVAAREAGNVAANLDFGEYQNWQNRQDTALRDLFNMGQTGQGNMANAWEQMQAPAQAMMGVGSMYEDLAGRQLNDSLRIQQEKDNQNLANLQALMGILSGTGAYGTTTQTAQTPNSTLSNIAGGLLGGASLLKGIL